MKRSAVVIAGLLVLSMFTVLGVSADVDGVFDIWEKDGAYQYVWWYNHDNTVLKGPEYKAQIAQLLADGYAYRGYGITESVAGSGPQFEEMQGEYEETMVYLLKAKSNDKVKDDGTTEYWVKSTPTEYQTQDGVWHGINDVATFRDTIDNVDVTAVKFEDRVQEKRVNGVVTQTWAQPDMIWNFGDKYNSKTPTDPPSANPTPNPSGHKRTMSVEILNADGTVEWRWDDTVSNMGWLPVDYGVGMDRNDAILKGEQYTVYYTFLVQTGGQSGAPQLMPKNYGQILNKPYNMYGLDEGQAIPTVFEQYVKYDGDKVMTYANSPLDIWFYRYVYKPNHEQSQQERIEATAWYQKAHGAFVTVN